MSGGETGEVLKSWNDNRKMRTGSFYLRILLILITAYGVALTAQAGLMLFQHLSAQHSPYGLVVTYYRGKNFEERVCRRYALSVVRDYGEKRPALFVPKDGFSSRWQGYLLAPEDDTYLFFSQSDDGLRLYLDGTLVLDSWKDQTWMESARHGQIRLTKGLHAIAVEHYDDTGRAALSIKWTGGGIPRNTVLEKPYLTKNAR